MLVMAIIRNTPRQLLEALRYENLTDKTKYRIEFNSIPNHKNNLPFYTVTVYRK